MSFNVKADVAECYRRAEEYKKLYHSASNLDEREMYLSMVRQFLRLAKDLEKEEPGPGDAAIGKAEARTL